MSRPDRGRVCLPRKEDLRGGFTIVEVVLAMGILVMGATAIIAFLTYGAATTRHAQLRTLSAAATEAVIADLDRHLFPFEDGKLGDPLEIEKRPVPDAPGVVYSAQAVVNPDDLREYRVDVSLTWESAGVQRSKKFQLLMLREISFGDRLRREFVERSGGFENTSREAGDSGDNR